MNKNIETYGKIIFGSLVIAIGIYYFWAPSQLAAGGVSGLSIVVQAFIPTVPISFIVLCLDLLMFLIGFFVLGASFGLKSIVSSISIAAFMRVFEMVGPTARVLSTDTLMVLILGTLFIAFGQALIFRQDASSGGTDIIAKIINKYTPLSIAYSLLIADMVVVLLAFNTFGVEKGLYAAFGVLINTVMIDFFIAGVSVEKYVMIIPSNEAAGEQVNDYVLNTLGRGATLYKAEGGYTREDKLVIATAVDRREFLLLKKFISQVDEKAFVTAQNLHEVMGEGFKLKS